MNPQPVSYYAREIRGSLPPQVFQPVPSRIAWLALHLAVVAAGIGLLATGWLAPLGLAGKLALSLIIGHSFAGMAFVGHETMHGAVVRQRGLRYLVGYVCFLPFVLSPRLWVAWHNRVHHGNTMAVGVDPDAYPTLDQYRASFLLRLADRFSFGRGHWVGMVASLALGFTGQSQQILWRLARPLGYLSPREHGLAVMETLLGIGAWAALAATVGSGVFLYAFVLPLLVGNAVVMAYIVTNHSLSPHTEINDPLLNSLSVRVPRLVDMLHLHFGKHVEHHVLPSVSSAYASLIRDQLRARWPERHQELPMLTALHRLATTPRVYESPTVLIDPHTGERSPTLLPGAPPVIAEPAAPAKGPGWAPSQAGSPV